MRSSNRQVYGLLAAVFAFCGVFTALILATQYWNSNENIAPGELKTLTQLPADPTSHKAGYFDQYISVNADGSWAVTVPSSLDTGVPLRRSDGLEFSIDRGEQIEITTSGLVNIGRGLVGPEGEPGYYDATIDGPFADHVGGLEMWIGPVKGANRFLVGPHLLRRFDYSGVPTLRVIESMHGYTDGNTGSFRATVRKR